MFCGYTAPAAIGDKLLPPAISDTTGDATALLVNVITPVDAPLAGGAYKIVTTCVIPGVSTSGNVGLKTRKPLPLDVPENTIVLPVPGLFMVMVSVTDEPTSTFPKYK